MLSRGGGGGDRRVHPGVSRPFDGGGGSPDRANQHFGGGLPSVPNLRRLTDAGPAPDSFRETVALRVSVWH